VPLKKAFLLAASIVLADPAWAFDAAQTVFYVSIPIDRHESRLSYGLRLQGQRPHESIDIDTRMLRFAGGGIEVQWLVVGAVAVGAAAAVQGDKRAQQQAERRQASVPAPQPCPQTCD
jgi:hypothetical protein